MHALGPSRKCRRHARLPAKPHANVIGPPQCPVVAIFALRCIGKPITMTAEKVCSASVKLGYPPIASNPVDNARTDKIRPRAADAARHPDNACRLLDILPFFAVLPNPIRQDQSIAIAPEPDRGDPLRVSVSELLAAFERVGLIRTVLE